MPVKMTKMKKGLKTRSNPRPLEGMIEHFTRLDDFRDRLRSIVEPNSILVLAAVNRKELLEMQAFRDMLTEIYIILVLPDRRKSTIKLGPSFKAAVSKRDRG